ncbi:MAG TPA: hypothetical protein VJ063_09665 [Verrucomicrobiae bacterium]|nr:hypothetical protein [Verrucomicrobiae bacterium]
MSSRAKTPDSLRAKFRRKKYKTPEISATDLIGIRVITYYQDDVDKVVSRLRSELQIDAKNSIDKRASLNLYEFGYRSVHLIATLRRARANSPEFKTLKNRWFEIQIRSILEHSWAEIEHEIIYKAGVKYPEPLKRRFASIAGTLEMLDGEFLRLRDEWAQLIRDYAERYSADKDYTKRFDAARLAGFLTAKFPEGLSWLKAKAQGRPFAPGIEAACVEALSAVGVNTGRSLTHIFDGRKFRRALGDFASANGVGRE